MKKVTDPFSLDPFSLTEENKEDFLWELEQHFKKYLIDGMHVRKREVHVLSGFKS